MRSAFPALTAPPPPPPPHRPQPQHKHPPRRKHTHRNKHTQPNTPTHTPKLLVIAELSDVGMRSVAVALFSALLYVVFPALLTLAPSAFDAWLPLGYVVVSALLPVYAVRASAAAR